MTAGPQLFELLTVAKLLSVSPHTIRSWVKKGKLKPVRLCRRLLFHPDDLAMLITEGRIPTGEIDRLVSIGTRPAQGSAK